MSFQLQDLGVRAEGKGVSVKTRILATAGAVSIALVAAPAAHAFEFSNPSSITIPLVGNADPYPSNMGVAGMSGTVTDVSVSLRGVSHTYLDDLGIVLQAPNGAGLMLMNGIGPLPNSSDPTTTVSDVDLDLVEDTAMPLLADNTVPTSGSYRPASYYPTSGTTLDSFPAPGPGTSYGNPGPAAAGTATFSSQFDGINANGTWKLFVRDFRNLDSGAIANGWRLDVETTGGGGDLVAPTTTITSGPSGTISQTSDSFSFVADEPASFECKLDSQTFGPCTSPKAYSGLAEGPHTFEVRATDSASNTGPPASRAFTVDLPDPPPPGDGGGGGGGGDVGEPADTAPPTVSITKLKVDNKKRTAKLEFTGSDNKTAPSALSFMCELDGKASPCTSPKTMKKLKPGKHTVTVVATDSAGNQSAAAVKSFKVKKPESKPKRRG